MAVTREWKCLAHGPFEGPNGVCPHGCTVVVREFRTAPGGKSEKTKISDRALDRLAARYKLTDMSNRNGSVGDSRGYPKGMEPLWKELPKGNNFEVGKGEVSRDGAAGGATAALTGMGMSGSVAEILSKKYGRPMVAEPNFMDIAKTLPRPRAIPQGHEPGSQTDLANAMRTAE